MSEKVLKIHPQDNVLVALQNLERGELIVFNNNEIKVLEYCQLKHKIAEVDLATGQPIYMYGVKVGFANTLIPKGGLLTTSNVTHATDEIKNYEPKTDWNAPDVSKFKDKTFMGYHRTDGSVGTANYWLVIPLVFCENRNIEVLKEALVNNLGYGKNEKYKVQAQKLVDMYKEGKDVSDILSASLQHDQTDEKHSKIFRNVDGVKFLLHDGGCGGTRQDATTLCGLLAGYITHSNCAGATILSLGCQNAQVQILEDEIKKRSPKFDKPLYILEQQKLGTEAMMLEEAVKQTFAGLMQANKNERKPAPLSKITIGLECGGSDGFSGISANPSIGYTSDLLIAMGGSVILAEFPELCGVETELGNRCLTKEDADKFNDLMKRYSASAVAAGSGFDMNPSPGNIKDGLITDAIKSAGAAKKGGTSPIVAVLDYPEKVTKPGLNLLCTPGNDVESTTAEVGSGANIVLFTTGLGTPTGNPITPVIKLSSNTILFKKMSDIIDINTGNIIEGTESIEQAGERVLEYIIKVASGEIEVSAVRHGQDDFIPWKRGVSL